MRSFRVLCALVLALAAGPLGTASAQGWGIQNQPPAPSFGETIQRVVQMPQNAELQRRAQQLGLNVVNVMWEDTGRFQGSSVGPNISDLTLQVREPLGNGRHRTHLLPVIRYPNFSDRTADVRANKLWVRVGNQRGNGQGGQLHAVPLSEVLGNLRAYLSDPQSLLGEGDFRAERDTHYLVSAQHVFVPIQSEGRAEFNPVLYNYQSQPGSPAVMTLLITRQGTSATIIENNSGDQSYQGWGQQLFFNHEGQRTVFTAERRSAVARRIENGQATSQDQGALDEGADMMMIVQVPLRHRSRRFEMEDMAVGAMAESASAAPAPTMARRSRGGSDVENAVVGHGDALGPFREMGGLRLERDPRFPVRVTVQFYRATSNGVIDAEDLADVKRQIDRVYEDGDFVGSLVVPENGHTRPTEWTRIRRRWLSGWVPPQPQPVVQPVVQPVIQPVVVPSPTPYVTQVTAPSTPFFASLPGTSIPIDPIFAAFYRAFSP
ncbi:MAG: hypothetical protein H6721_30490 [Sandaracinus sp.]|nr:hypothetical protein [Sandaracinus sp.]MCB9622339.1 hypothetical protein [Sandaracinus sp.]MCB9636459.1 hypothetical protein [Sandaracinus sp.]